MKHGANVQEGLQTSPVCFNVTLDGHEVTSPDGGPRVHLPVICEIGNDLQNVELDPSVARAGNVLQDNAPLKRGEWHLLETQPVSRQDGATTKGYSQAGARDQKRGSRSAPSRGLLSVHAGHLDCNLTDVIFADCE